LEEKGDKKIKIFLWANHLQVSGITTRKNTENLGLEGKEVSKRVTKAQGGGVSRKEKIRGNRNCDEKRE